MKRTSLWLILLILVPEVCKAYGYGSYSCGVRYSPYAFSYRHSGLVPGDVDYTPYAFSYRNSGLVPGYGVHSGCHSDATYAASRDHLRGSSHRLSPAPRPAPRHAQGTSVPAPSPDGTEILRRHLLARGCATVQMNRVLRIDNSLVSVDFVLKDRNLLIKYWNPREIELLNTKEAFKQKAYRDYKENWTRVAAQYEQSGGQVFYVEASDAETIIAALDSCSQLNAIPDKPNEPVLYAKD